MPPLINPFAIPNAEQSPYLNRIGGVGGAYDALAGGAQPQLTGASGNLISAGQAAIGPSEFDPGVASMLQTAANPVNTGVEDYFFNKYMADVNGRLGMRGLAGQGAGEGLANDASRGYLANRADTALGRQTSALGAANSIRTGQVGRAASLTGAGLSPYDTLSRMLSGAGNAYTNAGELGNQVGIANARNQAYGLPYAQNLYGGLAKFGLGALGGAYDKMFGAPTMSDSQITNMRDYGLTSEQPSWSAASGGGSNSADTGGGDDVSGWGDFMARGGPVGGHGDYDHVRALLTPQEFVVRRPVATETMPALKELNAGHYDQAVRKLAHVARVAH